MIGCFLALVMTGFFAVVTIYMTVLMSYFAGLAALMGISVGGMIAFFTALFLLMFG